MMNKRILSLLLTAALLLSLLPGTALRSYAAIDSGSCGDSASFVLAEDGTLKITGSGIVDTVGWEAYLDQIVRLEVSGPSELGVGFGDCPNLKTAVLGDSVEKICDLCFAAEADESSPLETVEFGSGIREIGYAAFYGVSNLKQVIVKDLGAWCGVKMEYRTDKSSYSGAVSPLYLGADLIYNGEPVRELVIPDSVRRIESDTFYKCKTLESVIIPASVESIGVFAFAYTPKLESVTFLGHAPEPDFFLFEGRLSYASGIFSYETLTFDDYPRLYIQTPPGDETYTNRIRLLYSSDHSARDLPGEDPNEDWPSAFLRKKPDPYFVNRVYWSEPDPSLIMHGACGEDATWKLDKEGVLTISGTGALNPDPYVHKWADYTDQIREVVIEDGITEISGSFLKGTNGKITRLDSVTIPPSVTEIEPFAFFSSIVAEIRGVEGSAAQTFAEEHGYTFIDLNGPCGHGHDWDEPSYDWFITESGDWFCRARLECKNDDAHFRDSQAEVRSEVTKEATTEEEGEITYTAVFPHPALETQTLVVKTPKLEKPDTGFTDVQPGAFYAQPVAWAVAHDPQITAGVSKDRFTPGNTCTRAQVVTFLWRAKGQPEPKGTDNPFTDVAPSAYYYKAVLWAVENGVTSGVSKDRFAPNQGCTRGQVVTFLWRTEGQPEPGSSTNPFTDVPAGAYYAKAVLWAVNHQPQITAGVSKDRFAPGNTCTRGQIVTFLYRAFAK